jgi:hypothetical protein
MIAQKEEGLPKDVMKGKIRYSPYRPFIPEVVIPFKHELSREELKSTANHFAQFITEKTGQRNIVRYASFGGMVNNYLFVQRKKT